VVGLFTLAIKTAIVTSTLVTSTGQNLQDLDPGRHRYLAFSRAALCICRPVQDTGQLLPSRAIATPSPSIFPYTAQ
jgi:hypothetical protein